MTDLTRETNADVNFSLKIYNAVTLDRTAFSLMCSSHIMTSEIINELSPGMAVRVFRFAVFFILLKSVFVKRNARKR